MKDDVKTQSKFKNADYVGTDALVILRNVTDEKRKVHIMSHYEQLVAMQVKRFSLEGKHYSFNQISKGDSSYDQNLISHLTEEAKLSGNTELPSVRISICPKGNRSFLRIELLGFPYSDHQMMSVRVMLEYLIGLKNYHKYINSSHISKVDIAADFTGITPDNLVFDKLRAQKGQMFFGRDGNTENIYIGDRKHSSHLAVYSRNAKLRNLKQVDTHSKETIRFEYRKKLRKYPLINLLGIDDPFIKIEAFDINSMINSQYFSMDFIDAITGKGLLPVLQRRDKVEQNKIKAQMHVHKIHWFSMGLIMELWRESAIQFSILTNKQSDIDTELYEKVKKSFYLLLKRSNK